jgi:hypothetical protein
MAAAAFLICSTTVYAVDLTVVEAEGHGPNPEQALENAQRDAIEKAVGVVIGGETLVRDYELLSDQILARSIGYVDSYEIINQHHDTSGDVVITIRARVGEIMDELAKNRQARELLLRWLNVPRVQIDLKEMMIGDTSTHVARSALERAFGNAGFHVVQPGDSTVDSTGNLVGELLLSGEAIAEPGPTPAVMKRAGMVSVQGSLRASLVQADTRQVLATRSRMIAAPHIDTVKAGERALNSAAASVADSLISDVLTVWAVQRANALPIELVVSGIEDGNRSEVMDLVSEVDGVRAVYQRSFEDSILTLLVEWRGTAGTFAETLQNHMLSGKSLSLSSLSWGRVELAVGSQ